MVRTKEIKITPYGAQYEQAHIAFASRYWAKGRRKNPEYIYWKFRGVPGKFLSSFLLAVDGDAVVGQLGLVPCNVMIAGKTYDTQWACDLMVDTAYRGSAVAKMLYEEAHRLKSITFGSDPSPAALISMTRAGYKTMKGPAKYILPISIGETIRIKYPGFNKLKKTTNPFVWYLKRKGRSHGAEITLVHWRDCTAYIDRHREQLHQPYVLHDPVFLEWRAEPFPPYYEAPAFVKHSDGMSYMCYKRAGNAFYINEWHCTSTNVMAAFLWHLVQYALASDIHFIHVPANSEDEGKILKQLGMFCFKTPTRIIYHCGESACDPMEGFDQFYYTYWDSDEYI